MLPDIRACISSILTRLRKTQVRKVANGLGAKGVMASDTQICPGNAREGSLSQTLTWRAQTFIIKDFLKELTSER